MCLENSNLELIHPLLTLTPYQTTHVVTYHTWMTNPTLLQLTASEPLTLHEEHEMQQSWKTDPNKCTFLLLDTRTQTPVGDVNLFFLPETNRTQAEIEVMVAVPEFRRRGMASLALRMMQAYAVRTFGVIRFVAKVLDCNSASLKLFRETMGYRVFDRVECFQETHMELVVVDDGDDDDDDEGDGADGADGEGEGDGEKEGEWRIWRTIWESIETRTLPLEEQDHEPYQDETQIEEIKHTSFVTNTHTNTTAEEIEPFPLHHIHPSSTTTNTTTSSTTLPLQSPPITPTTPQFRIRPIQASDRPSIIELARHTYHGRDWILPALSHWLSLPPDVCLPLGIEPVPPTRSTNDDTDDDDTDNDGTTNGPIIALEVLRLVDNGKTGWLEALRVHPSYRRLGLAERLQTALIQQSKERLFRVGIDGALMTERVRYTTTSRNVASIRLAERCGLKEVYRWGFVVSSLLSKEEEEEEQAEDEEEQAFANLGVSPESFVTKVVAALDRRGWNTYPTEITNHHPNDETTTATTSSTLTSLYSSSSGVLKTVEPATVTDIQNIESKIHSSASNVGLLCDWKVEEPTLRFLTKLYEKDGVEGWSLRVSSSYDHDVENALDGPDCLSSSVALLSRGYSLGKTRDDYDGTIRVFHPVVDNNGCDDTTEERYENFLHLVRKEGERALEDGATALMFFYELEFRMLLVKDGLAVERRSRRSENREGESRGTDGVRMEEAEEEEAEDEEEVDVCLLMSGSV